MLLKSAEAKNTIGKIGLISSKKESCAGTALFCVATEVKRKKIAFHLRIDFETKNEIKVERK